MKVIEGVARDEKRRHMVDSAANMADDLSDGSSLIGYAIVAMYGDGTTRTAIWQPNTEEHKLGSDLFQAVVQNAVNRHFAYDNSVTAACDVLNGDA